MAKVKTYLSLIKFSHTIFAMPFALIGFFLGLKAIELIGRRESLELNPSAVEARLPGSQDDYSSLPNAQRYLETSRLLKEFRFEDKDRLMITLKYLGLVVLCMVFARSAAMAFNRYLDRKFDALNPRTSVREIPAGVLKANSVLFFTIVNGLLFIGCTYFINPLCLLLSPVALLVVLGYSYTKRFTPLCHLILGLGLSLAPIGAFLAVTGQFHLLPILFSLAVIFWVSGFDIIYALQDEEFDRNQNLYSVPASLGKAKALRISELLHLCSALAVIIAGTRWSFGWFYWIGVAIFVGMLVYQHSLVKPNDLRKVNLAFMTANGIASVIFAIFVIADLFLNI